MTRAHSRRDASKRGSTARGAAAGDLIQFRNVVASPMRSDNGGCGTPSSHPAPSCEILHDSRFSQSLPADLPDSFCLLSLTHPESLFGSSGSSLSQDDETMEGNQSAGKAEQKTGKFTQTRREHVERT